MSYAPLVSALVTLLVTAILLFSRITRNIKDVPNERSLHEMPTPRIGGVGLMAGVLSGWAIMFHAPSLWILLPLLLLFVLSLIDDVRNLSARVRFAVHFMAAFSVVWGEGLFAVNVLWASATVFIIVWAINLYNFMDGSDGLAGGMALFGFSAYGIASLMQDDVVMAMICFSIGAAALAFLYFNFYPAQVFMGDAGSIPLGFLAASIGVVGWNNGLWPVWFPVMVFSPFILDATVTLFKRLIRGEKFWHAHREHYYQRLVQLGEGHRNTALIAYVLMFSVGASALYALHHPNALIAIAIVWCLIYGLAMASLDYCWKVRNRLRHSERVMLILLHDLLAGALAWVFAYMLRFNLDMPEDFLSEMRLTLAWIVPLQGIIFWRFGLYRGIWGYTSISDLQRIFFAAVTAAACIPLLLLMLRLPVVVPRSVLIIHPLLLLTLMGGSRLLYRLWKERLLYGESQLRGEPILILGGGDAAVALSKELQRSDAWQVVGFLDDDVSKHGHLLNGKKVHGPLSSLSHWAKEFDVKQAIIAMPSATHQQRKFAIDLCNQAGIKVLTVPSYDDLLSGRVSISQLRDIELDDLLGRDAVKLDEVGLHEQLTGKVVLVTGAGGSIGSELCRQIARFAPQKLVLYEASEFSLYNIEQELIGTFPQLDIVYLAGDVRDAMRLEQVFAELRPSVVFHAAAYKHVPLMERHNAWQAVRNNVYGTWQVAQCAQKHGVDKFVLISTDKAVNPTNVMGTTKRMAEMVCQGLQQTSGTRFIIVRFGNVLGSNGSVIPKFREQIAKGGPITVTHPEITRYFMSIPEAAQLVMQAGCMGKGGEIFVLDMGEPVKIADLAKDLIRLSGLSEDDIKIEFTGLRPGEKLYEELLADDENTLPTPHPKLRIAQARMVPAAELQMMHAWISTGATVADAVVRQDMRQWVPEYTPDERA